MKVIVNRSKKLHVAGMLCLRNKVTGVVTDSKGEPVIGAGIRVKGASNGTITDVNGKFALNDN